MSLLKRDETEQELLPYCKDNLWDFLKDDCDAFTERLFAAVREHSYLTSLPDDGGADVDEAVLDLSADSGGRASAPEVADDAANEPDEAAPASDEDVIEATGTAGTARKRYDFSDDDDDDDDDDERDYKRQRRTARDADDADDGDDDDDDDEDVV